MAMKAEVLEHVGKKMACPKEMQRRLDELIDEALHLLRNKKRLELVKAEPEDGRTEYLPPWEED
jgi:hypothetical protein